MSRFAQTEPDPAPVPDDSKPWYESKTVVFFALFAAANIAALFGYGEWTASNEQVEIVNTLVAAVGIALRFVTKKPIG